MTTTPTNASLADAVALFHSEQHPTPVLKLVPGAPAAAPRSQLASQSTRPAVTKLFQASEAAPDEQGDQAFDRLERGQR